MAPDTPKKTIRDLPYRHLADHYEACLDRHGDSHLGVDWPNADDAETRYRVMLNIVQTPQDAPVSLLDIGCGAGHLLEHIRTTGQSFNYQSPKNSSVSAAPNSQKLRSITPTSCRARRGSNPPTT
jgi:hypothetical protein